MELTKKQVVEGIKKNGLSWSDLKEVELRGPKPKTNINKSDVKCGSKRFYDGFMNSNGKYEVYRGEGDIEVDNEFILTTSLKVAKEFVEGHCFKNWFDYSLGEIENFRKIQPEDEITVKDGNTDDPRVFVNNIFYTTVNVVEVEDYNQFSSKDNKEFKLENTSKIRDTLEYYRGLDFYKK